MLLNADEVNIYFQCRAEGASRGLCESNPVDSLLLLRWRSFMELVSVQLLCYCPRLLLTPQII